MWNEFPFFQVYRDFQADTSDTQYLQDLFPLVKDVMETSQLWDTDGDGLIEHSSNNVDQTYDIWQMRGTSDLKMIKECNVSV